MLMAGEVKAALSCLGLSCVWCYVQTTREQVQQTVPHKGVFLEKNA